MLLNLPLEILLLVIPQLTNVADLKSLSEVSKSLYAVTLPYLYRSIALESEGDKGDLDQIDTELVLPAREKGLLRYTRALHVESHFPATWGQFIDYYDKDAWIGEQEEDEIVGRLLFLLEGLPDGKLRSFSWNVRTCVPPSILGPSGYLPLRQPQIESLRLVADGSGRPAEEPHPRLALSAFSHLRYLSCTGLWREEDRAALADALQQISDQLVEFELDMISCRDVDEDWEENLEDTFVFSRDILRLPRAGNRMFPGLRVLALSAVSLTPDLRDMMNQFDFGLLRSLTLRLTPGWEELLDHLTRSRPPIGLRFLEIQSTTEDSDMHGRSIGPFLESFDGLEALFLWTASSEDTLRIWRSARRHQATLRRFVHHQRMSVDQESDVEDWDSHDLSLRSVAALGDDPSQNPLGELDLESLGLCCLYDFLRPIISPFVNKSTLQILHLRQSGPALELFADRHRTDRIDSDHELVKFSHGLQDFAQWVFGPHGILSLRLLALGDFSYRGRFTNFHHLLCRQSPSQNAPGRSFRSITKEDIELGGVVAKHRNVLEACPTDYIIGRE